MSGKADLFMQAASKPLMDEKGEEKPENIISKIDKQEAQEREKEERAKAKAVEQTAIEPETKAHTSSDDISSEIAQVKPGKRRPQSMRRNEVGIRSMNKADVPDTDKNLTTARTFSIDMETSNKLDAVVKVLQDSGAIVDKRPISPSALVRIAVKRELQRLSDENGKAFDRAVEDEMNKAVNTPTFKI